MKYLLSAAMIVASLPAHAERISMTCKNPRREYVVTFDTAKRTLRADSTRYTVLAVEGSGKSLVVTGLTVNDGPTFRASFGRPRKMELFVDSKLFQTDRCR